MEFVYTFLHYLHLMYFMTANGLGVSLSVQEESVHWLHILIDGFGEHSYL